MNDCRTFWKAARQVLSRTEPAFPAEKSRGRRPMSPGDRFWRKRCKSQRHKTRTESRQFHLRPSSSAGRGSRSRADSSFARSHLSSKRRTPCCRQPHRCHNLGWRRFLSCRKCFWRRRPVSCQSRTSTSLAGCSCAVVHLAFVALHAIRCRRVTEFTYDARRYDRPLNICVAVVNDRTYVGVALPRPEVVKAVLTNRTVARNTHGAVFFIRAGQNGADQ